MSLHDFEAEAALAMTSTDLNGETATLYPKAGGSRSVQVVVDREGIVADEDGDGAIELVTVFISSDATLGVTEIVDGDQLELEFEIGKGAVRGRIEKILTQDAGGFLLEVHK